MTNQRYRQRAITLAVTVSASVAVHAQHSGDLFDPNAEVPATVYRSVLPESTGSRHLDAAQYPWTKLYEPDGTFIPESTFGSMSSETMKQGHSNDGGLSHEQMNHGNGPAVDMSSGATDSRGIIKTIYRDDGKVRIKHGPIDKLEMPGMTMIFYVRDQELLDGLSEGDEVGFDVEMDGSSFYIIRFAR